MSYVVQVRSEILGTINDWITLGGGAQDVLDDPQLYESILTFLEHPTDHSVLQDMPRDDQDIHEAVNMLYNAKLSLHTSFLSQTMRPSTRNLHDPDNLLNGSNPENFGPEPPNIDQLDAEELVNNLDSMASAAFRNVSQEVSVLVRSWIFSVLTSHDPGSICDCRYSGGAVSRSYRMVLASRTQFNYR